MNVAKDRTFASIYQTIDYRTEFIQLRNGKLAKGNLLYTIFMPIFSFTLYATGTFNLAFVTLIPT